MPVEIRLADSALADLNEIQDWYAGEGVPDVGLRLIRRIMGRGERLLRLPDDEGETVLTVTLRVFAGKARVDTHGAACYERSKSHGLMPPAIS